MERRYRTGSVGREVTGIEPEGPVVVIDMDMDLRPPAFSGHNRCSGAPCVAQSDAASGQVGAGLPRSGVLSSTSQRTVSIGTVTDSVVANA
jgi:hypothetical protein